MDKKKNNEYPAKTTNTIKTTTTTTTTAITATTLVTTTATSNANDTKKDNSLATANTSLEKVATNAAPTKSHLVIEPELAESTEKSVHIIISMEDDNPAVEPNICIANSTTDSNTTLIPMPLNNGVDVDVQEQKVEHNLPLIDKLESKQLRTSISKILDKTNINNNNNNHKNDNSNYIKNIESNDIDNKSVSLKNENCENEVENIINKVVDTVQDTDDEEDSKNLGEQTFSKIIKSQTDNVAVGYLEIQKNDIAPSATVGNILKPAKLIPPNKQTSLKLSNVLLCTFNTTADNGTKTIASACTAASNTNGNVTNTTNIPNGDSANDENAANTSCGQTESVNGDIEGTSTSSVRSIGSLVCRICHNSEDPERLVSPCLCKGSLTYVHIHCLERWITLSRSTMCELCQFQYNTEQTLRYTCFQSLRLWYSRSMSRRALQEDCQLFSLLTLVAFGIVGTLLVGIQYYILQGRMWGIGHIWTKGWLVFFLLTTLIVYFINIYMIIRSQLTPWYRWWQSARDIKLILENRKPFTVKQKHRIIYTQEPPRFSIDNETPSNVEILPTPPPPPPTPLAANSHADFEQESENSSGISPLSTVFTRSDIAALNRACNQVLAADIHQCFDTIVPDDEQP